MSSIRLSPTRAEPCLCAATPADKISRPRAPRLLRPHAEEHRSAFRCDASRSRRPARDGSARDIGRPPPSRRIHASRATCMNAPQDEVGAGRAPRRSVSRHHRGRSEAIVDAGLDQRDVLPHVERLRGQRDALAAQRSSNLNPYFLASRASWLWLPEPTVLIATLAQQVEDSGAGRIIAWMGDEVPTQFGGLFAAPGTIADQRELTKRFVRAYVKAIELYDRAFQRPGSDGRPVRGDGYDELIRIIAE